MSPRNSVSYCPVVCWPCHPGIQFPIVQSSTGHVIQELSFLVSCRLLAMSPRNSVSYCPVVYWPCHPGNSVSQLSSCQLAMSSRDSVSYCPVVYWPCYPGTQFPIVQSSTGHAIQELSFLLSSRLLAMSSRNLVS
jgi:hypothetical protein